MPKALLVDDEPQILKALARVLRRGGFDVELASNGPEALAKLEGFAPDLVVSDFRMPEMSGDALLAEIKKRSPLTLRIILSGCADLRSILSSINEGEICRFLTKPWDDVELVTLLKKLLVDRELLAQLYKPFSEAPGVATEALQSESKVVVRLAKGRMPLSPETIARLLTHFTDALEASQLQMVGGLLERHAGRVSFVADIGATQTLTLELPLMQATTAPKRQ